MTSANRSGGGRAVTPDRLPPAQSGSDQAAARRLHPVLELQRSAGNRATATLVADGGAVQLQPSEGGGQLAVQRSVGAWFRKKLGLKPKVSKPTGGHAMLPGEQNGVPSARELIEIMEKGGAPGSSISDESVEGVGSMFEKEEVYAEGWGRARGWDRGGTSLSDESVEGVGGMFGKAERDNGIREERRNRHKLYGEGPEEDMGVGGMMERSEEEAAKADDDRLYDGIKKAADALRDPKLGNDQAALDDGAKAVQAAIALWRQSPRRLQGLPEDKGKNREIEALLQELKWTTDKTKVGAAGLLPNPELKPDDKTGYFVAKTVKLYEVKPDGSLATGSVSYTNDVTLGALPELAKDGKDGYGIAIGAKTYWVAKTDVVIKHGTFDKVAGNLFDKEPSPEDVKQTTLGDCYLQASIASIASQNPGLIKAMMRDNGDDSITVRLYKVDDADAKNHKFDPQYIRVEKSVPKDSAGNEVYNAGAIWVRMIEKAYAAGGFMGRTNKVAPTVLSYEGIAAGQSRHALEVLTGKQSSAMLLDEGPSRLGTDNFWTRGGATSNIKGSDVTPEYNRVNVPWEPGEVANHVTAKANDNYDNLLSFKILKDKGKVDAWITYVKTDKIKDLFVKRDDDRGKGFATQLTLTDFDTLFKAGLGSEVADAMLQWIESQKLYPGELGTAKYSQTELDAFAKIKQRLDEGGEVTGATQEFPSGTVTAGTGASGGEAVGKGMVGNHVYTFLAYRANSGPDPADLNTAGQFYWLRIRNPWGNYGRKYDMSKGKDAGEEVKDGDGVSWLELSDLTKFFYNIHFN